MGRSQRTNISHPNRLRITKSDYYITPIPPRVSTRAWSNDGLANNSKTHIIKQSLPGLSPKSPCKLPKSGLRRGDHMQIHIHCLQWNQVLPSLIGQIRVKDSCQHRLSSNGQLSNISKLKCLYKRGQITIKTLLKEGKSPIVARQGSKRTRRCLHLKRPGQSRKGGKFTHLQNTQRFFYFRVFSRLATSLNIPLT